MIELMNPQGLLNFAFALGANTILFLEVIVYCQQLMQAHFHVTQIWNFSFVEFVCMCVLLHASVIII
jgi:hypothetical protein